MKRIPVYIDDDVEQLLRDLATEAQRPFNALIREAMAEYLSHRGITVASRVHEPQKTVDDPEQQTHMLRRLQQIHDSIETDLTPDEIEDLITEVSEEMRRERMSAQLVSRD